MALLLLRSVVVFMECRKPKPHWCFRDNELITSASSSEIGAEFAKLSLLEKQCCSFMPLTKRSLRPRARRGANRHPAELEDAAEWITSAVHDPMVEIDPVTMAQHLLDTEKKGGNGVRGALEAFMSSSASAGTPSTSGPLFVAASKTPNALGGVLLALGAAITLGSFAAAFHPLKLEEQSADGNDSDFYGADEYEEDDKSENANVVPGVDPEVVIQSLVLQVIQQVFEAALQLAEKQKLDATKAAVEAATLKILNLVADNIKEFSQAQEKESAAGLDNSGKAVNQEALSKLILDIVQQSIHAAEENLVLRAAAAAAAAPDEPPTKQVEASIDPEAVSRYASEFLQLAIISCTGVNEDNETPPPPGDEEKPKEEVDKLGSQTPGIDQDDADASSQSSEESKQTDTVSEKEEPLEEAAEEVPTTGPAATPDEDGGLEPPGATFMTRTSDIFDTQSPMQPKAFAPNGGLTDEEMKQQELISVVRAAIPAMAIGAGAASALTGVEGALEMVGLAATAGFVYFELVWAEARYVLNNPRFAPTSPGMAGSSC